MRRARVARALLPLWLAAAAFFPAMAFAEDEDSIARDQFDAARRRFDRGDHAGALELFELAWQQSRSPNARLYVARCLRELGRVAEAHEEFRGTLRDAARSAADEPRYAATRDAAGVELAMLELRVGRVVVTMPHAPPGSTLSLDGDPLSMARIGTMLIVRPGVVRLAAAAPGHRPAEQEVAVEAGELRAVTLSLRPIPPTPLPPPPQPDRTTRAFGFAMLGFGGASLVVSVGTGAAAASSYASLQDACGGERCLDRRLADVIDTGKHLEAASLITLVTGVSGLVAGGVLVGVSTPSGASVGLAPTPAGLVLRGAF